jgi:hypothetical protein
VYQKEYPVAPLLMDETTIGSEIMDTNQHFIYLYDFNKAWTFLVELIQVIKNADADMNVEYPLISRVEGVGPMQYGTKGLLGEKFADIEEKYDLSEADEGFGEEGEDSDSNDTDEDEDTTEDDNGGFFDDSSEAY